MNEVSLEILADDQLALSALAPELYLDSNLQTTLQPVTIVHSAVPP